MKTFIKRYWKSTLAFAFAFVLGMFAIGFIPNACFFSIDEWKDILLIIGTFSAIFFGLQTYVFNRYLKRQKEFENEIHLNVYLGKTGIRPIPWQVIVVNQGKRQALLLGMSIFSKRSQLINAIPIKSTYPISLAPHSHFALTIPLSDIVGLAIDQKSGACSFEVIINDAYNGNNHYPIVLLPEATP